MFCKKTKPVPSWHVIPGGLSPGKIVEIRGMVPYRCDRFQINFTAGMDNSGIEVDRLLHLNVRFDERAVVRNARLSDAWGREERDGGIPFSTGQSFAILILVEQSGYRIAVDGRHQWEFYHRLDMNFASHVFIDGPVQIHEIKFCDKYNQGQGIGTCVMPPPEIGIPYPGNPGTYLPPPPDMGSRNEFISNPAIPFLHYFPEGIRPGMMISISGKPFASANRFTINLQCGAATYPPPDIGFHMDVRFFNSTVVRNTRVNNSWDSEETYVPHFPFVQSSNFDIILKVESDRIMASINGQSCFEFRHRIFPCSKFDTLCIEKDVILNFVKIDF